MTSNILFHILSLRFQSGTSNFPFSLFLLKSQFATSSSSEMPIWHLKSSLSVPLHSILRSQFATSKFFQSPLEVPVWHLKFPFHHPPSSSSPSLSVSVLLHTSTFLPHPTQFGSNPFPDPTPKALPYRHR